jgi:hypothetical protein
MSICFYAYRNNVAVYRLQKRKAPFPRRKGAFSKLEAIFCAFQAENNFVNALILFYQG